MSHMSITQQDRRAQISSLYLRAEGQRQARTATGSVNLGREFTEMEGRMLGLVAGWLQAYPRRARHELQPAVM